MIIKYENGEIYDSDSLSKDEKKSDLCVFTILENIANSKKIRSDISKLKKQEKIFEAYGIPANEKLVAYLKKSIFGLTTDGMIFTDKAMYVYTKNMTHKPMEGELFSSNRIPYTEFCDYIITHKHDKAGVFLNNTTGKYCVCDKTMFLKNQTGEEIYTVIKALQSILCNTDLDTWNKRESLIEKFFELSDNDIRIGELSSNFQEVIESLLNDKSYFDKAIYVLAKNAFRLCNKGRYFEFIDKYNGYMSQEIKKKLEDATNEFIYELLDDLSNIKLEFKREYIEKVYKHLIHVCANNKDDVYKVREYMQIFFFVCMRNNQHILGRRLIKDYISIYGKSSLDLLQDFACIYGNKQMKKVFDILKTGKELDKEYYKVVDSIGLTPLHYALIMNLPEYISILANSDCYDIVMAFTDTFSLEEVKNE